MPLESSKIVVAKVRHEMYVGLCIECPSFKRMGTSPAIRGMISVVEAQNAARDHTKETGHTVTATYRREEEWVQISGAPPEG